MVRQPALQVVTRHPCTPTQFEQLREVKLINSYNDVASRQNAEHTQLVPKNGCITVLQGVIKNAIPVIEQHHHVDHAKVQAHASRQQTSRAPFIFRLKVRQRQRPDSTQLQTGFLPVALWDGHTHRTHKFLTPLTTCPAGTWRAADSI